MKKIYLSFVAVCLIALVGVGTSSVYAVNNDLFSNFTSDSYVLLDSNSNTILVSHNENQKMPVASICKLMTTLIALEKVESGELNLTDKVVASEYAASMEGSQAFLDAGQEYTISDLLKSVVVASANDSAVVLAEAIAGSEQAFVSLMNSRAKELGMNNTVYSNSTGLPAPNQYSTALDSATILKHVVKFDLYNKFSKIWMDDFKHSSGRTTELVNTNRLIKYYKNCTSGKTGYTDEAGYCLTSTASNNDLNLIAVTLKCDNPQDRFKESMDLYNYGFANFTNNQVIDASKPIEELVKVNGGNVMEAQIGFEQDFYVVGKKSDKANYDVKLNYNKAIKAPLKQFDTVGEAIVLKDGKVLGRVNIVVLDQIEKQSFSDVVDKIIYNWSF